MKKAFFILGVSITWLTALSLKEDRARRLIEMVKLWRLQEELSLEEEEAVILFKLVKEKDSLRIELIKKKRALFKEIKQLLDKKSPSKKIKEKIKEVREKEKYYREKMDEIEDKIEKTLPPEKYARYLLFNERFEREVREIIKTIKEKRRKR